MAVWAYDMSSDVMTNVARSLTKFANLKADKKYKSKCALFSLFVFSHI